MFLLVPAYPGCPGSKAVVVVTLHTGNVETKNRDALNDNDTRDKNTRCLILEKVVAMKGPAATERVELLLPGSFSVCGFFGPAFCQCPA